MIKGELTPAAVVLTQRQNFLPPTEQLGPPLTLQGRRYHSGHGSSKKPDMVGIEPETSCAEAYTLTTRPNPTPLPLSVDWTTTGHRSCADTYIGLIHDCLGRNSVLL
jgi:hypothetical protein